MGMTERPIVLQELVYGSISQYIQALENRKNM